MKLVLRIDGEKTAIEPASALERLVQRAMP